tara:strand:- start:793 stop:1125 length:333 start_codon:yes stop_codon:yes gene_type:complete
MAFIKIEGIVDKPLGDKGFILLETIRLNDGRTFDKKWKVWAIPLPEFSSFVEVTGEFSSKISEYEFQGETKHSQDLNVNNPVVKVLRDATVASPDVVSDWATPPTQAVPF